MSVDILKQSDIHSTIGGEARQSLRQYLQGLLIKSGAADKLTVRLATNISQSTHSRTITNNKTCVQEIVIREVLMNNFAIFKALLVTFFINFM